MMTEEEWKAFEALIDDTDIVMSMDGEKASYHTKRLASVLHVAYRELKERREDEVFLTQHTYEVVPHKDGSVELYLDCCGQSGHFKGPSLHAAIAAARGE